MIHASNDEIEDDLEEFGCGNPRFTPYDLISFMIIPAVILIIFFACYVKRKNRLPNTCGGRPGTVYAVNLLDSYRNRVAHGCAIGVSCVSILDLFFGKYYVEVDYSGVPLMVQGLIGSLVLIANIWMVALVYFPIALCLTTKKKLMGNLFGFAYTLVWAAFYAQKIIECPRAEGRIGELNFLLIAPIFVLYFWLLVQFAKGTRSALRERRKRKKQQVQEDPSQYESFTESHYSQRVVYLLTPKRVLGKRVDPKASDQKKFRDKMKLYFAKIYPNVIGFKYSKRMVVTAILTALSLYEFNRNLVQPLPGSDHVKKHGRASQWREVPGMKEEDSRLGIAYMGGVGLLFEYSEEVFDETGVVYEFFDYTNTTETFYEIKSFWYIVIDSFLPTCIAAMGIAIFFSFNFLYLYRRNTLDLWRGVKTLLPNQELKNPYLVASSLRYSGYHVGFALWGFLILQILFWLITVVCWFFIVRAWRHGQSNWLLELCRNQWLTGVLALVIYYLQIFLARVFYLEGKGEVLSLTNRRSLHNTTYFFMFLNIVLGLLSCLLRIGYSILFGILMVGRIDLCLLMKGFEFWDSGFKSYLAFLRLEVAHTHPVVVSFCYLLWGMRGKRARLNSVDAYDEGFHKKHTKGLQTLQQDSVTMDDASMFPTNYGSCHTSRVARNRWHVAYTLVQNPSLVADRSPEALWKMIHGSTPSPEEEAQSSGSAASSEREEKVQIIDEVEDPGEKTRSSTMSDHDGTTSQDEEQEVGGDLAEEADAMTVVEDTPQEDGNKDEKPIEDDAISASSA